LNQRISISEVKMMEADLFHVLCEYIIELHHHLSVDGFARLDVFELEQHVERPFRRPQSLERLVDESFRFNC